MMRPLSITILGLSLSSAWGNGHATTYRALVRGLAAAGHDVLFLERRQSWYADNRDLADPDWCRLEFYESVADLRRFDPAIRASDVVVVGSYVPDGVAVIDRVAAMNPDVLCFYDIDTPVTLDKLDRGDEEYLALRQLPLFDTYFSFAGGEVLTRLETLYGARRADALYCSVDPKRYHPTGEEPVWDLGYLGTYSADRQPALDRMLIEPARRLPHRRFVVAGPQYPSEIDWPANVERIDHLAPDAHASFYSRQRYTLNVTRQPMIALGWSPSVRLFEAAACGTAVISDRWRGLEELFPDGDAIRIADTTDDVVSVLDGRSGKPAREIAEEARRIVLSAHTGEARAREFAAAVMRERKRRGLGRARDAGTAAQPWESHEQRIRV